VVDGNVFDGSVVVCSDFEDVVIDVWVGEVYLLFID